MNSHLCHTCGVCRPENKFVIENGTLVRCHDCQKRRHLSRFQALCPPLYRVSDESRLPQLPQVLAWRPAPPDKLGLLLRGPTGRGKTRCAWLLIKNLLLERLQPVEAFDCVSFGHELSRRYRDDDAEDWLDRLARHPLVFFDDLGKLKMTERAEAELFGVIERRTANQLPTIATTNDSGSSLSERMTDNRGPALIRRLREFSQIIEF